MRASGFGMETHAAARGDPCSDAYREVKPGIWCWRDHSAGRSQRRATPMPRGRRPSITALTRSGARKASEIVMRSFGRCIPRALLCPLRLLLDRTRVCASQRRPRAIDATKIARVSDGHLVASHHAPREFHGAALNVVKWSSLRKWPQWVRHCSNWFSSRSYWIFARAFWSDANAARPSRHHSFIFSVLGFSILARSCEAMILAFKGAEYAAD